MTVFRASGGGDFEAEPTTSLEVFEAGSHYPVSIDIRRLSTWWPQTFEYLGRRCCVSDRG